MSIHTYKCPNCSAGLSFDPHGQNFSCDYCHSVFTQEQLVALSPDMTQQAAEQAQQQAQGDLREQERFGQDTALYSCPSCGAEVITDDTTAATLCVYCHNPVVSAGRLAGEFRPDHVIPFAFDAQSARDKFVAWCRKKWFIKRDFVDLATEDNFRGVYFPFWLVEGLADVDMTAQARTVRVWRAGDVEYTEAKVYRLERRGRVDFGGITLGALRKEHARMLDGVYPYNLQELQPFSMPYLSGFLAEKRNVERTDAQSDADREVRSTCETLLRDTTHRMGAVTNEKLAVDVREELWEYAMLPAWIFTYKYGGADYFFSMNGQTGKIAGRVPLSGKRLGLLFGLLSPAVMLFLYGLGWLLA